MPRVRSPPRRVRRSGRPSAGCPNADRSCARGARASPPADGRSGHPCAGTTPGAVGGRRAAASARRSRPECAWRSFLSFQAAEPLVELRHLAERVSVIRIGWGEELWLSLIHISEPTRLGMISYAVFCLKKKK